MDLNKIGDGKNYCEIIPAKHLYSNSRPCEDMDPRAATFSKAASNCKINAGTYVVSNLVDVPPRNTISMPTDVGSNTDTFNECNNKNVYITDIHSTRNRKKRKLHSFRLNEQTSKSDVENDDACCSKDIPTYPPNHSILKVNERKCAEKTTYCRPVVNMYNQEFIYRTLERNAKLKRIVKNLVQARQMERRGDEWNNYINDLKNKHRYNDDGQLPQSPGEYDTPQMIDDYYDTRFNYNQSNSCKNSLKDFYGARRKINYHTYNKSYYYNDRPPINPYVFENVSHCYPTASQGYLAMNNRERAGYPYASDWQNRPSSRYYRGDTIFVDKVSRRTHINNQKNIRKPAWNIDVNTLGKPVLVNKSISIQRDLNIIQNIEEHNEDKKESFLHKYSAVTKNLQTLKKKITKSEDNDKNSLTNIENKLNNLIKTINIVLEDIKNNRPQKSLNNAEVSCKLSKDKKLNAAKSDTFGLLSKMVDLGGVQHVSRSTVDFSDVGSSKKRHESNISKINEILNEELDKSNKIKQEIDRLLMRNAQKPCPFKISFDIPTKERSTEVTSSLSKTKASDKKLIDQETDPLRNVDERMTIAVNTDPLGLLALFRVSTETIKQMLSYMPSIDYYSYLSMLQFPQTRSSVTHYICNICGAAFDRPSQLSDHIQEHNLGKARDCCVCRHFLDSQAEHKGLFACRYCGQRFIRAYCCDLHQQACAKRLGVSHDVHSDLLLLR